MLGFRGVRLYVLAPDIARSQTKAILAAAARCVEEGIQVRPEIQIPMVVNRAETLRVVETIHEAAREVEEAEGVEIPYKVGVMVETPAAVRTVDTFSGDLQFLSYGVNDLTQTVLAVSRDDTGHFMGAYEELGIVGADPFRSLDPVVKTSWRKRSRGPGGPTRTYSSSPRATSAATRTPCRSSTTSASTASARAPGSSRSPPWPRPRRTLPAPGSRQPTTRATA